MEPQENSSPAAPRSLVRRREGMSPPEAQCFNLTQKSDPQRQAYLSELANPNPNQRRERARPVGYRLGVFGDRLLSVGLSASPAGSWTESLLLSLRLLAGLCGLMGHGRLSGLFGWSWTRLALTTSSISPS